MARLMPNVGGPPKHETTVDSVVLSALLYGAAIWSDALKLEYTKIKCLRRYGLVGQSSCPVSEDAVYVIAGMLFVDMLTAKRQRIYQQRSTTQTPRSAVYLQDRERSQTEWNRSPHTKYRNRGKQSSWRD